ncbi:MAG: universal stress protein [Proteobacteria bacterium]|nr:universal stress protein [Pseudomonadota bacterium]
MFRNILFPVDFSPFTEKVLPCVLDLAERYQARIHLLYVADDLHHVRHLWFPIPEVQSFMDGVKEAAIEKMDGFRQSHFEGRNDVFGHVIQGDPASDIVKFVKEHEEIDLIVLGSHGHGSLDRIIFGSVAESVSRHSPITVMIVKPGHEDCAGEGR